MSVWDGMNSAFNKSGSTGYYGLGGGPAGIGGIFNAANSIFGLTSAPQGPPPPPDMPTLQNTVDANGNLKGQYQLQAQPTIKYNDNGVGAAAHVNTNPLHQLESYAEGTGNSPWASLALQQNQNALQNQLGSAADNNRSGTQAAISDLAASGGATQGARERVANQSTRNLLDSTQNARSASQQNALGIQEQDANNRLSVLEQLPGQEVAAVQPGLQAAEFGQGQKQNLAENQQQYKTGVNQANISNAIGGVGNANNNALNIYGQQMAGYAANQTANAIQNAPSGKKGGGGGGKK